MGRTLKIALANDHAGYELKVAIKSFLEDQGHQVRDFGSFTAERADYPDFAHPMASAVENGEYDFGISMCGSGNGINMTANKHQDVRSALCWAPKLAELARRHNNANVCALPARFITVEEGKKIISHFLRTGFEGGRHQVRIDKIPHITL
jgi:ribose 5-phosphate isomerase B